jgi:four helix bundle protein
MKQANASVRRLKIWQKSVDLVLECYRLSNVLPSDEKFGLVSQIRRAATSVPANIAEGFGRWNGRDFGRFLAISSGSLRELETHLLVASKLGYLGEDSIEKALDTIDELAKMLYGMRQRVLENVRVAEQASARYSTGRRVMARA